MSATYCVVQYTVWCTKQYTVQCTKQHTVKCTTHVKYNKNSLQTNANIAVHLILHLSVKNIVQYIGQYHCSRGRQEDACSFGIRAFQPATLALERTIMQDTVYSMQYCVQYIIQQCPGQYGVQCKVKFTGSKEGNVPCGVSQPNQAL